MAKKLATKVQETKIQEIAPVVIFEEVLIPDSNAKGLQPKNGHYLSGVNFANFTQYLPRTNNLANIQGVVSGSKLPENYTYKVIVLAKPK